MFIPARRAAASIVFFMALILIAAPAIAAQKIICTSYPVYLFTKSLTKTAIFIRLNFWPTQPWAAPMIMC